MESVENEGTAGKDPSEEGGTLRDFDRSRAEYFREGGELGTRALVTHQDPLYGGPLSQEALPGGQRMVAEYLDAHERLGERFGLRPLGVMGSFHEDNRSAVERLTDELARRPTAQETVQAALERMRQEDPRERLRRALAGPRDAASAVDILARGESASSLAERFLSAAHDEPGYPFPRQRTAPGWEGALLQIAQMQRNPSLSIIRDLQRAQDLQRAIGAGTIKALQSAGLVRQQHPQPAPPPPPPPPPPATTNATAQRRERAKRRGELLRSMSPAEQLKEIRGVCRTEKGKEAFAHVAREFGMSAKELRAIEKFARDSCYRKRRKPR